MTNSGNIYEYSGWISFFSKTHSVPLEGTGTMLCLTHSQCSLTSVPFLFLAISVHGSQRFLNLHQNLGCGGSDRKAIDEF